MATIYIGSARIDENGKISGGQAGDQTGKEVMKQQFYVHSKGWYVIRPISVTLANTMAQCMSDACDNDNIGYDQNQRLGVVTKTTKTKTPTEADCGTLVRAVVKESSGKDPGNFTTSNAADVLDKTGLFEKKFAFVSLSKTPVYNGDILVTKTKGHIVIVTSGNPRKSTSTSTTTSTSSNSSSSSSFAFKISDYQKWLNKNFDTGLDEDNKYGKLTRKGATKAYQSTCNTQFGAKLDVDGVFGSESKKYGNKALVKKGTKGTFVKIAQGLLRCEGYYTGELDGDAGTLTYYAIVKFQRANSLSADGKCGANTWYKLCN